MEARADARADATDTRLRAVEQSITQVEGKLDLLEGKLDLLTGQIVGKLPTWWQMLAMFVAIAALLNGLPLLTQTLRSRGMVP